MSAVFSHGKGAINPAEASQRMVPIAEGEPARAFVFGGRDGVLLGRFLAQVRTLAALLPEGGCVVNLCEDRYRFLLALCAAGVRGQATLLPPSRAPEAVREALDRHHGSYCLADIADPALTAWVLPADLPESEGPVPCVASDAIAVVGYTSGSTGVPVANAKTWGSFRISTAQNFAALGDLWDGDAADAHVVATVPPQHMYGMELSVLLPLLAPVAVHAARPFFPQDIAIALAQAPDHRLLVTTPVHLRALVESGLQLPPMAGIVSATAPLPPVLAAQAEQQFHCEVRELFGSTETCVFARRRTASESAWTLFRNVTLQPQPDGTLVDAPQLAAPVRLADLVELCGDDRFELRGRNADLLEIAGKRASLSDLTRKLQSVPGVLDGIVVQTDPDARGVRRIAALAVAPGLDEAAIMAVLRRAVDPAFLPRPLRCVAALPRNETGKLPREALLSLLRSNMP